ncbi:tRNA (N6-isopentenyl adenosine(37)-C2)-methylthiotransferase MiaB [Clostridium estertheticum]|uniref:tRNA (N6-isopentenyl adenosine(37)-C2)-methylthiotransferase MiaB n=1 Tax=Clostridium estertheticum TaxID=238834 RepID=UPI001CF49792|nr:tRNA (N6-isopentenyl adenosine(37)-C2)-methylthiotransferase MiaB [Clostridium estertheticum]MCB2307740.1 tRNA (N6-isopentenyl adenosine(37)-C2)-methylthiotransferase MiaB [Clostridium estertheticum]MCB2345930.1 tRNA (N6-isopentenyl adenosine(37)-C2)-methylthiotransferase MiaB [Clostridium estertheticum]MCB2351188.1 tRNA (N6-isopentenyl adenosine(37)-C2)-methylthiotransferase MiaB [Clostridium estertheticum]WAG44719.1 tRNA (N6-isopentenyl adenosine(37)-C2)-methylthiotransferase MiaB [Clostri
MNETIKYYIETWGCQMNEEDSEKLSGMLIPAGYKKTLDKGSADIIIFNTCCVRENAEQKVDGNIGALKTMKKENPKLVIAVIGCMMQQDGMAKHIITKFPFVDIIIGTHNAYKFPEYLKRIQSGESSIVEIWDKEENIIEGIPIERENTLKGFVTIMYGCNNFCTYCIVPYVRGRERSRNPEDIINEITDMVGQGYKEITLLGQNVNSYGKGLTPEINFAQLLRKINKIENLERLRFMTSHPKDLSNEVIKVIAESDKICEHVHLPVQSGSSNLLNKMNRHYDREQYLELVKNIRNTIPNVGITTDIIVGFPGETEEDFAETLSLMEEVKFNLAFTYLYSKRKGTPADEMLDQVPEDVKHERFNRLVEVVNRNCAEKNKACVGKIVEVLVEGYSKKDESKLTGRTRNGKVVNFEGNGNVAGDLVSVLITDSHSFSLFGDEI